VENKIREIIGNNLDNLDLVIDSVVFEKEGNNDFLRICLDSKKTIDLDLITEASHIINDLIDNSDLELENYNLDIYGKSKGEE
jgi:ribosome maturation factor RimP